MAYIAFATESGTFKQSAPVQFRLLYRAVFRPTPDVEIFANDEHSPLEKEAVAA